MSSRRRTWAAAACVVCLALAVAGCGRRGPLDAPSASMATDPAEAVPGATPGSGDSFVLDALI
ncbi:LPS translocon maturation chaperone LptM [Polymorphum gilvum]|uniref:LPS translocon maturation chaperone LptM n=1 Tax=Polymorphum gilvum TaxID=991904 RepID=UPI0011D23D64